MRGGVPLEFDATLKEFFQQQPTSLLSELTGGLPVVEFLNVELPSVQERRLDLVLLLANETLLHIELQSSNDRDMGLRMLEYYVLLWRRYRKPLKQVVVYVGQPRMRMIESLEMEALRFSFALRDIREWRAKDLLSSSMFGDQVLAILGGTDDPRTVIRGVLERISKMVPERRERALRYMLNLAGLRKFGIILEEEVARMGVTVDWSQYTAVREMVTRGKAEGKAEGEVRGVRDALLMVLEKRFGPIPVWAQQKIEKATKQKAMAWLVKAGDAAELTDLIPRR
jgi:predicted transposase YdaD